MRKPVSVFLGGVALSLFLAVWGVGPAAAQETYKVGVTIPMSGPLGIWGDRLMNGMNIAAEEINAKGGIKGKKIELVYEDHKGDPNTGVAAYRKLVSVDKVPAVITIFTGIAFAQIPVADETKTIIFSGGVQHPDFTKKSRWAFRNTTNANQEIETVAEVALRGLKKKRIAVLHVNDEVGRYYQETMERKTKELGGQIVVTDAYENAGTDFRSQLTKVKAANPEILAILGTGTKALAQVVKQAAELGIKAQILSNSATEAADLIDVAGKAAEGIIYAIPAFDPDSKDPLVANFVKTYKERSGGKIPDNFAGSFHDAVKILALAIEKGGYDAEKMRSVLLTIKDFPGVTGKTTFLPSGDSIKPITVRTIKDGKFVPYKGAL